MCALVCPHAAIRVKQIEPDSLKGAPDTFTTLKSKGKSEQELQFKVQVYIEDCTGCGNCIEECLPKEKALTFSPIETERETGERRIRSQETR